MTCLSFQLLLIGKVVATVMSGSLSILSSLVDSAVDLLSGTVMWCTSAAIKRKDYFKYPSGIFNHYFFERNCMYVPINVIPRGEGGGNPGDCDEKYFPHTWGFWNGLIDPCESCIQFCNKIGHEPCGTWRILTSNHDP